MLSEAKDELPSLKETFDILGSSLTLFQFKHVKKVSLIMQWVYLVRLAVSPSTSTVL